MTIKKGKGKHMADVTKPPKRTAAPAAGPKLVIPKRSIIPVTVADGSETPAPTTPAPKMVAKSVEPTTKLAAVTPIAVSRPEPKTDPEPEPKEPKETPGPSSEPSKPADEAPAASADDASEDTIETDDASSADDEPATPSSGGPSPHVKKLLEDAKHDQEIQTYIDNRQFFVPINAVAHKRSIKVSTILIFVELILGIILLDLMLDSGLIDLVQKIPHTHFFGLH